MLYGLTTREFSEAHARHDGDRCWRSSRRRSSSWLPTASRPFLLLSVTAFWCARRDRWALAALAARARRHDPQHRDRPGARARWSRPSSQHRERGRAARSRGRPPRSRRSPGPCSYLAYWFVALRRRAGARSTRSAAGSASRRSRCARSPTPSRRPVALPSTYWLLDLLVVGVVLVGAVARAATPARRLLRLRLGEPRCSPCPTPSRAGRSCPCPGSSVVIFPAFWVLADLRRTPAAAPTPRSSAAFAGGPGAAARPVHQLVRHLLTAASPNPLGLGHAGPGVRQRRRTGGRRERDDQGCDRGRPLAGAPGPAAVPRDGRRHRGGRRGRERAGAAEARRGDPARDRARGHPDAGDGRPRGRPRAPRQAPRASA